MKISASAGFITIVFEQTDWNLPHGGAQAVIIAVKREIGHVTVNPDGFTYNPDNYEWTVKDTPKNRSIVERLKATLIDDPDQISMFQEKGERE